MPQYRISDTLLIDTNMILSEEDVAAIMQEEEDGSFVPERWNVQAVEYVGKVVGETVTIPAAEYAALKDAEAECLQQRSLIEEMQAARKTAVSVEDQAALEAAASLPEAQADPDPSRTVAEADPAPVVDPE